MFPRSSLALLVLAGTIFSLALIAFNLWTLASLQVPKNCL